jgi:hypothetical protein
VTAPRLDTSISKAEKKIQPQENRLFKRELPTTTSDKPHSLYNTLNLQYRRHSGQVDPSLQLTGSSALDITMRLLYLVSVTACLAITGLVEARLNRLGIPQTIKAGESFTAVGEQALQQPRQQTMTWGITPGAGYAGMIGNYMIGFQGDLESKFSLGHEQHFSPS